MKRELEEQLASKWPEILRGRDKPPTESLMAFGFEHGDGWYSIVDSLCEVLTDHARETGRESVEATQIKQKMSTLRFYVSGFADDFEMGAILLAQELSGRICEKTGAPGRLYVKGGYYITMAPDVASQGQFRSVEQECERRFPPAPFEEVLDWLSPEVRGILVGPIDCPSGWSDLIELLLNQFVWPPSDAGVPTLRVHGLAERDGRLTVQLDGGRELDEGAAAFASAISRFIDPVTGVLQVPNLD